MFNLDQAISEWRKQMAKHGIKSPVVMDELESHLRDETGVLVSSGVEEERAFDLARRRLGGPGELGKEFAKSDQVAAPTRWSFLRCFYFFWAKEIPVPPPAAFALDARRALDLARQEALSLGHDFVGTEHVLLAVLSTAPGALAHVFQRSRVSSETIRAEVGRLISSSPPRRSATELPLTPRARRALRLAGREAGALKHPTIGAEHILFGLLREGTGVAAMALRNLGLRLDRSQMRAGRR